MDRHIQSAHRSKRLEHRPSKKVPNFRNESPNFALELLDIQAITDNIDGLIFDAITHDDIETIRKYLEQDSQRATIKNKVVCTTSALSNTDFEHPIYQQDGETLLIRAALEQKLEIVRYLLTKKEVNVNAQTKVITSLFISIKPGSCPFSHIIEWTISVDDSCENWQL